MTLEEFQVLLNVKKEYDFTFRGRQFSITYGTDSKGDYICFGETFFGKRFYSFGELMNEAMIDNTFFREILSEI